MIEPWELRPLRRRATAAPQRFGSEARAGSQLALPSGDIAGDLRPLAGPSGGRTAAYELLIANDTAGPVAAFTYAAGATSGSDRVTWDAIVVPPHSAVAHTIEVRLPRRGKANRIVAELHADGTALTFDAPPPHRHPRGYARRLTLLASGAFLLCVGGGSFAATRPHVIALAAPDTVKGGVPFSVAYALRAHGDAEFFVADAGGDEIAHGTLPDTAGAFTVALPERATSAGYDVRVVTRSALGADMRAVHVVALAAPAPAPPHRPNVHIRPAAQLAGVALEHDSVHGGETVAVKYQTKSVAGSVRLIDELGTVRAEALLNRSGTSLLVAPQVDADQDFRVVVTAQHGAARDEATVPLRVLHAADVPPPLQPAEAPGATAAGTSPIDVAATSTAGAPIVIRILRHEPALHVAVVDSMGTEVAAADVDDDAPLISLASPKSAGRVSVVATFAKGYGQETVVRPVTLQPR